MARVTVRVRTCDHCGQECQQRFTLIDRQAERQVTFDTCSDCSQLVPLSEWRKLAPRDATGGRTMRVPMVVPVSVVLKEVARCQQGR